MARFQGSVEDRFWAKVTGHQGFNSLARHWLWEGYVNPKGYAYFQRHDGMSPEPAHRVARELVTGHPIPAGLQLFNTCGLKACVNPAHWDLITYRESRLRVNAAKRKAASAT
jgi:hypothetical protein